MSVWSAPVPGLAQPSWAEMRRVMALRVLPGLVFGLLGVSLVASLGHQVASAVAGGRLRSSLPGLLGNGLYLGFVGLVVVLVLSRPPARARDASAGAWLAAMVGTFGMVVAPLLPQGPRLFHLGHSGQMIRLALMIVVLGVSTVALAFLGRSFSLTPEARSVVTAGPYRLVRHPLYLCESVAILGALVAAGRLTVALVAAIVIAVQVLRSRLEERLLATTFPDYEQRFKGVPHFWPGLY